MIGFIYAAFDTTNGMFYVGQTRFWPRRKEEHLKDKKKKNDYFHRALKIRPEKFQWSLLLSAEISQRELNAAEIYFGRFLDSLFPNGYNLSLGNGKIMSQETKSKISENQKRLWSNSQFREKQIEKISRANRDAWKREEVRERTIASQNRKDVNKKRAISQSKAMKGRTWSIGLDGKRHWSSK